MSIQYYVNQSASHYLGHFPILGRQMHGVSQPRTQGLPILENRAGRPWVRGWASPMEVQYVHTR
jgi:hypothetical protein